MQLGSSSCLVSSLYFVSLFFCCGYFSLLGCYYILHTIRHHSLEHRQTFLRRCFLSSSVDCDFSCYFARFFALLHLCTHLLCLSILFLSNMLLADTLFSSRSPLLAALYFGDCVDFFVGHADFTPTLESANNCCCFHRFIGECEGHLLCCASYT